MKFLFVSVATLLTANAVHLNREQMTRTAAQPGFADPYNSLEVMDRQREVSRAQTEIGGPIREAEHEVKVAKEQKAAFSKSLWRTTEHNDYDKPFTDKEGRQFYPMHSEKPIQYNIQSSTWDFEDKEE